MPIQTLHLRSSVQGKEPVAGTATGQLPVGSIGINFNATEPFLTIQDSAGNIRRIAGIKVGATAPATPTAGEAWLDTTVAAKPIFKVHDGSAWQGAGSGVSTGASAPTGAVSGDLWVDTSVGTAPVLKVYNGTAFVAVTPDASDTAKGVVELATVAEAEAGTDTARAVTPAGLKAAVVKISGGASNTAPSTPTTGQLWTDTSASPPAVKVWDGTKWVGVGGTPADASETVKGIAEIATQAEVNLGTDDLRFVTPAKLATYVTDKLKMTWLPSDSITPTGTGTSTWNGPADTLAATGAVKARIGAGAWGAGGAVTAGTQVSVHWDSADVATAAHGATLTGHVQNADGSVVVDYNVVIDKLPTALTIAAKTGTAQGGVVESDASNAVGGLNAAARLWLASTDGTNAEVSIAGGSWTAIPATAAAGVAIDNGQLFKIRHTTKAGALAVTTTTVNVGWDTGSSVQASFGTTNAAVAPIVKATDPTVTGTAQVGISLTATAGTATGGTAPLTYATKWQTSADGTTGWADIAGATALTYAIQAGDKDQYLRALTTATDSTAPTAQTLDLPSIASAKVAAPVVVTFSWNADTDAYTRDPVANRIIDVHVCIRRCLLTDAGVPTYLDADDSTKLAGDWLRLCETTELDASYTGTHGAEVANTALRTGVPAWAAGTYTKDQRVTNGGSVWECIAANTTATPAAGAAAATLDGGAGQVMVEIPRFSVWHETAPAGSYQQHTFHLVRGTKEDGGYAVHPAFIKPDNSYRDFIYVGAYLGTGTNGNGSASGVDNTVGFSRATCRAACAGRGAGWHQLGYWDYNALQWLFLTEYEDMNSQKVLGNGSMHGAVYVVHTGLSDGHGNRTHSSNSTGGSPRDYVSYRGVENIYGRSRQWVDGLNMNNNDIYLCADPSKWADDTATNYVAAGHVGNSYGDYQRDLMSGIALFPSSVTGASAKTFIGDGFFTNPGWRVSHMGGNTDRDSLVGIFCTNIDNSSPSYGNGLGGRLAYSK